ncbi:GNAT family N-acetyltransferase [Promicromonospora sukumoe]|uniref:GNAT family N-acetyltransferase n=1 Tax=Promicromonospora sukumoe TaxID=88382 RepID=UPI0012FC8B52|nr:GNAT family N-acetyltransferase [Promicromonospora sukumoe]
MTSQMMVDLVPVGEDVLEELLALAVAEAVPGEVMPPASGESADEARTTWTELRKGAFRDYHRRCRLSVTAPVPEVTWAVRARGRIVGAARLALVDGDPDAREVGLWLGESYRGHGIAGEVAYWAVAAAQTMDARRLVARTVASTPARTTLERIGFEVVEHDDGLLGTITLP